VGNPFKRFGSRKLSDEEFERAKAIVLMYLAAHDSITNRDFRALTELNYDQAITCFNRMIADGHLIRVGKTTGTRYLLSGVQALNLPAPNMGSRKGHSCAQGAF
jgi:hypothetical protein